MFVKTTNGQIDKYPYTVGDLRRDNPNVSFPRRIPDEMLNEYGVYRVNPVSAPAYDDRTQRIDHNSQPHMEGSEWFIGWTVVDKTAEEVQQQHENAAQSVRSERDRLLIETDWVVIMHTEKGTNIPADMEIYRQALRDITAHANFPYLEEADWPVKPA